MTTPVTGPQYADDPRQVARWIDEEGKVQFDYLDITDVSFKGRFGMAARSDTEHDVSIGNKTFYLDRPVDMRVGDDVQIVCLNNYDLFMWGEIADIENAGEADMSIEVYIDDICPFDDVNQTNWEIQVVARPKPGIEKDVSFTEIDPSDVGPFSFEVTAGKFFPVGGQLLIKPTADRTIALLGRVLAYEGTTLWVEKNVSNASISEAYDSWSIALLDAPPAALPLRIISGMELSLNTINDWVTISPGSVMDSTGRVLLTLTTNLTKAMRGTWVAGNSQNGCILVQGPGTISCNTTSVVGTGTNFLSFFQRGDESVGVSGHGLGLDDYKNSGGTREVPAAISISTGLRASSVLNKTTDTALTTKEALSGGTSATYFRGATSQGDTAGKTIYLFLVLIRKDTDGSLDACYSSATVSGEPDLPPGYTYYRVLGVVKLVTFSDYELEAHLHKANLLGSAAITSLPEKAVVEDADLFLIADSSEDFLLKKVLASAVGTGGGGGIPTDWGLITDPIDAEEILDFGTLV
jgi:hypothetical protein